MWRSQTFKEGELSLADGIVTVRDHCISEENLSPAQIAKLEAHPKWFKVESESAVEEPALAEEPTPPKRKRGRPRKTAAKQG